jgi:hypothetical protein
MSKQRTRRRRTRCAVARAIAVGGAVATLVAVLGASQALAATAQPDERILERKGLIDQQAAEQSRADAPARQGSDTPRRFFKPEPKMDPGPWIDDEQAAPDPPPPGRRPTMAVPVTVTVLLVLALGVAAWWLRHRARPEPAT